MRTQAFLGISLALIISCWYVLQQNSGFEPQQATSEHFGNLSSQMKQSIRDAIQLSAYKYDDLDDMSGYIKDTLDRLYAQSWQVYIFGQGCYTTEGSSSNKYYNHWAWFTNYGPKDYCYYTFKTVTCKANFYGNSSMKANGQMWGDSFKDADKVRIKALIQQASLRSTDPYQNTLYIKDRMGSGSWAVTVGTSKNHDFGFYVCMYSDYWALLWEQGAYKWDYIIHRY